MKEQVSTPPPGLLRRFVNALFFKPLTASSYNNLGYFLKGSFLWRSFKPYYHLYVEDQRSHNSVLGEDPASFFNQNAARVNAVADMLADEKSKKIYLGIIKYRQTLNKKDYPFHAIKEFQYFIKKMKYDKNEVFIDCGAYIGDTIDLFLMHCKEYKRIIAFEPVSNTFEILKKRHGNNPKITFINAGVYDNDGEVLFAENSGDMAISSKITDGKQENSTCSIQVRTIDGLGLESASFIKMDIEGAELNALKGAEKTILRDKPKLAISIYHSDEDMIRIAEYIHALVPEYNLYVRQYTGIGDTVLYAIMP